MKAWGYPVGMFQQTSDICYYFCCPFILAPGQATLRYIRTQFSSLSFRFFYRKMTFSWYDREMRLFCCLSHQILTQKTVIRLPFGNEEGPPLSDPYRILNWFIDFKRPLSVCKVINHGFCFHCVNKQMWVYGFTHCMLLWLVTLANSHGI